MTIKLRDTYETGEEINSDPLVYVFEDFLVLSEIEHLLEAAEPKLQKALVSAAHGGVKSAGRSGSNCWIPHDHSLVTQAIASRVAALVGMPLDNAESFQVVHYDQNQEYGPHFDAWDAATERGQRCMAKGGQRLVTCLLYLNNVEAGGGTCFPQLDIEVSAKKGRMLLFHNCYVDSAVCHPSSLHGGMPVLQGQKWACNLWFREKMIRDPR
jgi:prolyl 4-hydroxylase